MPQDNVEIRFECEGDDFIIVDVHTLQNQLHQFVLRLNISVTIHPTLRKVQERVTSLQD
jgi:hypothetical protein